MSLVDTLGRLLGSLRISVTDRCNLRCLYCMPEAEYVWLPRSDILTFEELAVLVDVFIDLGVDKIRITGGEPLLRRNLPALIELLSRKPRLKDLALTTNGLQLSEQAQSLRDAGLRRITISLDTLRADRFQQLTRFDALDQVLGGIAAAKAAGFTPIKLDTVVIRNVNDDELSDLINYARATGVELRFIEYMDVGGATRWSMDAVVSRQEILAHLEATYGAIRPVQEQKTAPADRFMLADGTVFGIISSTTAPFCASCDRSRLTADGLWYLCLYATVGVDLRRLLRAGATPDDLRQLIEATWRSRRDRGAEERLSSGQRSPFLSVTALQKEPHLEMHTRGG